MMNKHLSGVGLGLRREMLDELLPDIPASVDFWELAPENWIPLGGKYQKNLNQLKHGYRTNNRNTAAIGKSIV